MLYDGIQLTPPAGKVFMSNSHAMDMIRGKSSDQNIEWMEAMYGLPWGKLKETYPEHFEHASKVCSISNMDYQVCNGGISQYFFNRYNEARDPYSEHDVGRLDISVQKSFFSEIVDFAKAVYPDRTTENAALEKACKAFDRLEFEENAQLEETIYCDEDEYIYDEELEEDVPNPDYFEPYEETYYEDVIHGDEGFDDIFYEASDYLEELLELQSQLCCKKLVLEIEKSGIEDSELLNSLKTVLPEPAFAESSLSDPSNVSSYYEICVAFPDGDYAYSVFVEGAFDANEAVEKAVEDCLFDEPEDVFNVNSVGEISREEYLKGIGADAPSQSKVSLAEQIQAAASKSFSLQSASESRDKKNEPCL